MVSRLKALSISTIEEFVSLYFHDPVELSKYLEIRHKRLKTIVGSATKYLEPETLRELRSKTARHPTGARSPFGEEFEKYISKRRAQD